MSAIFQVYGLTDAKGARTCRALTALSADVLGIAGSARGRMQIMGVGKWEGHPKGPFEVTHADLENMIAVFDAQKNPLVVDYDHSAPDRGDTRAAGWIHDLEIVGDWLWASVEWTPAAAEAIRAGEYKFNSPWWGEDSTDRVSGEATGPRLLNVALTNMPFFDGQQPLRCSTVAADEPVPPSNEANTMDEFLAAVAKSSGLTPEAVASALPAMADQIGAMLRDAVKASEAPPATEEPPKDEEPKAASSTITASEAARIASDAKLNGLIASVAALTAAEEKRSKAEADARTAADTKLAAERTARIDGMILCGQLTNEERDDASKLLAFDAAIFESTYGGRPKKVPTGVVQAGNEPRTASTVTSEASTEGLTASELIAFKGLRQNGYAPDNARTRILAQRPSTN